MNVVFWILAILFIFLLWLAISFMFIPLGRKITKKIKEILKIFNYEEKNKDKEK